MNRDAQVAYRPLFFLSTLGAGGLSVSFFVWIMFLVPHPNSPIPTFNDLRAVYTSGSLGYIALTTFALIGTFGLGIRHLIGLARNLSALKAYLKSSSYRELLRSHAEIQLMAVPLTLGMTVNVAIILAVLAIPGLWSIKEALFPVALLLLTGIGALALTLFGRYLGRAATEANLGPQQDNHFSQALPSFALAMVSVGFSSSAAMSSTRATIVIGILGTLFFAMASLMWLAVRLPISLSAILSHGMAPTAAPTLWMGIPILTLLGIATLRVIMGTSHQLTHTEVPGIIWLFIFGAIVSAQLLQGLAGWAVMRRQRYFDNFVLGDERDPATFGLVCPGVALVVLSQFFIHWGLVQNGIVERFSMLHWALLGVVFALQMLTLVTLMRLDRQLLCRSRDCRRESQRLMLATM